MTVTIIGTGRVAFHLGKRFVEKGVKINQIFGRNYHNATWLASLLKTNFETDLQKINTHSDIYIIAVSDNSTPSVAEQLSHTLDNQLVVHTSGTLPSNILQPYFKNYGSFYPLQTFSLESQPDFEKIPIFINATSPQYFTLLEKLAETISDKIFALEDEKRVGLHIAAVFVNNFTNQLFKMAYDILEKKDIPFDVLKPLIQETVNKIQQHPPNQMQTGPAKRGDLMTIQKHLNYLTEEAPPQYPALYKIFTTLINEDLTV